MERNILCPKPLRSEAYISYIEIYLPDLLYPYDRHEFDGPIAEINGSDTTGIAKMKNLPAIEWQDERWFYKIWINNPTIETLKALPDIFRKQKHVLIDVHLALDNICETREQADAILKFRLQYQVLGSSYDLIRAVGPHDMEKLEKFKDHPEDQFLREIQVYSSRKDQIPRRLKKWHMNTPTQKEYYHWHLNAISRDGLPTARIERRGPHGKQNCGARKLGYTSLSALADIDHFDIWVRKSQFYHFPDQALREHLEKHHAEDESVDELMEEMVLRSQIPFGDSFIIPAQNQRAWCGITYPDKEFIIDARHLLPPTDN